MRIPIKQSRPQNLNDAIRLPVELETFNVLSQEIYSLVAYL
jgi:hypothetical protein